MIIVMLIFVTLQGMMYQQEDNFKAYDPEGFRKFNKKSWFEIIGFSFMIFDGVGSVLPLMQASKKSTHSQFPFFIFSAITFLIVVYSAFSTFCMYAFGNLEETIIWFELEPSTLVLVVSGIISVNLVLLYAITIYPTNQVINAILFSGFNEESKARKLFESISSTLVAALTISMVVLFYSVLDEIIFNAGLTIGISLSIILPASCHFFFSGSSTKHKIVDSLLILIGIGITAGILGY